MEPAQPAPEASWIVFGQNLAVTRESIAVLDEPPPPDADARVVYGPEPLQFGDLRLPSGSGPHPVVMMIHGGYWQAIYNLTHAGHLCLDLAAHGVATWNVEYRRIGDPGGGWPGALDDVSRALAHLSVLAEDYPLDIGRTVVMGHSAGGHLALLVARRAPVSLRAVVSLSGVVDLRATDSQGDDNGLITRMMGGRPEAVPDVWDEASPSAHLPLGFHYVLACGTEDIHWEPNEAFAEQAREAGDDVELLPLPGAGHFELVDPLAPEWVVIRAKLQELLL
jgi:acetyl esterase/lipase